jgi:tetraacyldisaccharide 4'-kinase
MKPPSFWYEKPGLRAALLKPLATLWTYETRRRLKNGSWDQIGIPVICIGNLTAGGTGKTPLVVAVLEYLQARGVDAHALTRGYGGSIEGPALVDPASHDAAQMGDEPLLLAAFAKTWVSADRLEGARAALRAGAQAIVMDDGFQNPALAQDLSFVVVDAQRGLGNERVMPAGPLREPASDGLARADAIVITSNTTSAPARFKPPESWKKPVLNGKLVPLQTGMDWQGLRALAFAGIGHPDKFFTTLKDLGADLVATHAYDDHAPYSDAILSRLQREAATKSAQLVTTEKDAARLPAAFRTQVITLPVRMEIREKAEFSSLLDQIVIGA